MRTQREKNEETLLEEIERLLEQPLTNSVAEKLCVYYGALAALRPVKTEPVQERTLPARVSDRDDPTLALDGDTEFERAVMAIPVDWEHMERLIHIFAIHMENLAFANKRAYNKILEQIENVAMS